MNKRLYLSFLLLTISAVGYIAQDVTIDANSKSKMNIKLKPDNRQLKQVTISSKKGRYSRKNNPAVELMKKVIAAKKLTDLHNHEYYRYDKYEKLTLAANNITPEQLEKKPYSSTPWLREQVEMCQYNNKLILPLSVDETVTEMIWQKSSGKKKSIIQGQQSSGINDLFQTGDILNVVMKDVFKANDIPMVDYFVIYSD